MNLNNNLNCWAFTETNLDTQEQPKSVRSTAGHMQSNSPKSVRRTAGHTRSNSQVSEKRYFSPHAFTSFAFLCWFGGKGSLK